MFSQGVQLNSISHKAFIQSSSRLRDSILEGDYRKAEDWLIAYQRHLTSLSQNISGDSLKQILKEQKEIFTVMIDTLNQQRNAEAIERIKALDFYNKARNQAF